MCLDWFLTVCSQQPMWQMRFSCDFLFIVLKNCFDSNHKWKKKGSSSYGFHRGLKKCNKHLSLIISRWIAWLRFKTLDLSGMCLVAGLVLKYLPFLFPLKIVMLCVCDVDLMPQLPWETQRRHGAQLQKPSSPVTTQTIRVSSRFRRGCEILSPFSVWVWIIIIFFFLKDYAMLVGKEGLHRHSQIFHTDKEKNENLYCFYSQGCCFRKITNSVICPDVFLLPL